MPPESCSRGNQKARQQRSESEASYSRLSKKLYLSALPFGRPEKAQYRKGLRVANHIP
jgi:hypothetical protein